MGSGIQNGALNKYLTEKHIFPSGPEKSNHRHD